MTTVSADELNGEILVLSLFSHVVLLFVDSLDSSMLFLGTNKRRVYRPYERENVCSMNSFYYLKP